MDTNLVLQETDRSKLDDIVGKMQANGESDDDIRLVVNDFKTKYGKSEQAGSGSSEGAIPTVSLTDKEAKSDVIPIKADVVETPVITRLRHETAKRFSAHPDVFSNPKNRDIYYNTLKKSFSADVVDAIIGDDKGADFSGATTSQNPDDVRANYFDELGKKAQERLSTDPTLQSQEARDAYWDRLKMFAPVKDRERLMLVRLNSDPYLKSWLKKQQQDDFTNFLDPTGGFATGAVQAAVHGVKGGIEKIGQTGEAYREAAGEGKTQADVMKGVGSAALNAIVGAGETILGGANIAIPELAAFTVGSEDLQNTAPQVAEWMSPVSKVIADDYAKDGVPPPKWAENAGAVADFVLFIAFAKGGHKLGKIAENGRLTEEWAKEIDALTPEEIDKAMQMGKKLREQQEEHTQKVAEMASQVKKDKRPIAERLPEVQGKVEQLQGDLEAVKGTPAEAIIQEHLDNTKEIADDLEHHVVTEKANEAVKTVAIDNLSKLKADLESQASKLSDAGKEALQPQLDAVNQGLKDAGAEIPKETVQDKPFTAETQGIKGFKDTHQKSEVEQPKAEETPSEQVTEVKEETPAPKESAMNDSWRSEFDRAKKEGDTKAIDLLYNKVKVALNGIAQSKGEQTVKEFQSLKKDIEQYAEDWKKSKAKESDKPTKQSQFKQELLNRGLPEQGAEGSSKLLVKALTDKNTAYNVLDIANKNLRELWSKETGVELPKTQKGTRKAVDDYFASPEKKQITEAGKSAAKLYGNDLVKLANGDANHIYENIPEATPEIAKLIIETAQEKLIASGGGDLIKSPQKPPLTLYHGKNKVVTKHAKTYERVKHFDGDILSAIKEDADKGIVEAKDILENKNLDRFARANQYIHDKYKGKYDAVRFDNNGREGGKVPTEYLDLHEKKFLSTDRTHAKLYSLSDRAKKYEFVEKPSIAEIKSKVIKKAPESKASAKKEGVSLKVQKDDLLGQIKKASDVVRNGDSETELSNLVNGEEKQVSARLKAEGFTVKKGLNGELQVEFDVEGDGTFRLAASGLDIAHEEVTKHWKTDLKNDNKVSGVRPTPQKAKAIGDYSTLEKAEKSKQDALDNLESAKKSGNKELEATYQKQAELESDAYKTAKREFDSLKERVAEEEKLANSGEITSVYDVDKLLKLPEDKANLAKIEGKEATTEKPDYALIRSSLDKMLVDAEKAHEEFSATLKKKDGTYKRNISNNDGAKLSSLANKISDIKERIKDLPKEKAPKDLDLSKIEKNISSENLKRFQDLSESIREGKNLLRSGLDAAGKKLTEEGRTAIEKSVESARKKIVDLSAKDLSEKRKTDSSQKEDDAKNSTSFDKMASASSRFRPHETVVFDKPIVGPNGNKLVSYGWAYEWTMQHSGKDTELKSKRISDWTQAQNSAETGRDIVHKFTIEKKDGTIVSVSSESVPSVLGYTEGKPMNGFASISTAVKTLAKQRMKLAIMEAKQAEYDDAIKKYEKAEKPEVKEIEEPIKIVRDRGDNSHTVFAMDDVWYRQDNPYDYHTRSHIKSSIPTRTTIENLTYDWIKKRAEEDGVETQRGLYDLKRRVERQEKKVAEVANGKINIQNKEKSELAKKKVSEIGEKVKKALSTDLPEGTEKLGVGVSDLVDAAVKVIHASIDAGFSVKEAIEKGVAHIRDNWSEKFGELPEERIRKVFESEQFDKKKIKLTHEATGELRKEAGLGEREKPESRTVPEMEAEADARIKEGVDVNKMADDILAGTKPPDRIEHIILSKKIALLNDDLAKIDVTKPEFDKALAEIEHLVKASEYGGSQAGGALGIRSQFKTVADQSLADYFLQEKELNNGADLTENQKATVKKEYEEITKAKEALEAKVSELEKENEKLKAQKEFEAKVKKRERRAEKKEALDAEFEDLSKEFSKIIRGTLNAGINPEAVPIIAKMVKNRIDKGVIKLSEVVDQIHDKLSEHGISKEDIMDVIAGKHNAKKQTRSDAAKQLFEIRKEARLITQYEDLMNGKEPSSERRKIERNQKLEALRKQIKEHDLQKLADYKKRLKSQAEKLDAQLQSTDPNVFAKAEKKAPIVLDAEAKKLKDEYIKKRQEREMRILRFQYENRNAYERTRDKTLDVLNVPRTLMSSMDFSAPLRQSLVATVSHPSVAAKAFAEMFRQAGSQKVFDRWFYDVKDNPRYSMSKEAGLYIADPHDPRLSVKEEAFMNNLAEKIPVAGKLIKGSERAYIGYLNKMRWDLFNKFADEFEAMGKTFDNSPELYKSLADYVNNSTGRGKLGPLETSAPILNTFLFAPRLIASRVNMLTNWMNPMWYKRTPKEVRVEYFKSMAKVIALGTTVLALAKLNGAEVEDDPRSSDFGKIKSGNTRWDIWGGHQQYIRLVTQMLMGESKSTGSGKIVPLTGEGPFGRTRGDVGLSFLRGKLAPIPAMAADVLAGRMVSGEKTTLAGEAEGHLLPLLYSDVKEAVKDQGVKALFTVGLPSTFGVGVQTYTPKEKKPDKRKKHTPPSTIRTNYP